jgi:hypothetical protein
MYQSNLKLEQLEKDVLTIFNEKLKKKKKKELQIG